MKFAADRPWSDPEKVARKLLKIANDVEVVQDGRIYIELINGPFLFREGATPAEYKAGLDRAIERGWLVLHDSGPVHAGWRRPVCLVGRAGAGVLSRSSWCWRRWRRPSMRRQCWRSTLIPVLPVGRPLPPSARGTVRALAQACVLKLATEKAAERVRHGCVSSRLILGRGIDWAGRRRGRRHRHRLERSHLGHVFF